MGNTEKKSLYVVVDERPACGSIREILFITFCEELAWAVAEGKAEEGNIRVDLVDSYSFTIDI